MKLLWFDFFVFILHWTEWIIKDFFPFSRRNLHNLCFCMIPNQTFRFGNFAGMPTSFTWHIRTIQMFPTTNCERLSLVRSQMINFVVIKIRRLCSCYCCAIVALIFLHEWISFENLQVAWCCVWIRSKAKKYLFEAELVCLTNTMPKIKFQEA